MHNEITLMHIQTNIIEYQLLQLILLICVCE